MLKLIGEYWVDENGNKWRGGEKDRDRIEKAREKLIGCYNCIDCYNCVNCFDCVHCIDCIDCVGCIDCEDCEDCENCTKCVRSYACVDCVKCKDSYVSINCDGCIRIARCVDCVDCKTCYNCVNSKQCQGADDAIDLEKRTFSRFRAPSPWKFYTFKIKINENETYWIDQNGNKWDVDLFTRKQAYRYSHSLENCEDCVNCIKCINCKNVKDSRHAENINLK